ncbi:MAG: hypothetical protein IPP33_18910 [Flavobacteriales bacterium]|nr:hypothetical protein [Flavobacteriales bacterium]
MVRFSDQQIQDTLLKEHNGEEGRLAAPLIAGEKDITGSCSNCCCAGDSCEPGRWHDRMSTRPRLASGYKVHDIELVVDRVKVSEANRKRQVESCDTALNKGKGNMLRYGR